MPNTAFSFVTIGATLQGIGLYLIDSRYVIGTQNRKVTKVTEFLTGDIRLGSNPVMRYAVDVTVRNRSLYINDVFWDNLKDNSIYQFTIYVDAI